MIADDLDHDGNLDLLTVGNLYATQPDFGRYDASNGLVLLGDGKGMFRSVLGSASGFVVEGEGRDIKSIRISNNQKIYLVSRNDNSLEGFRIVK